ncbi:lipopolysaccharide core heptosyltransferase RfaQ [bacterium BMS3Abin12]|nr:lipopolysaccharide core heptosyltransferase RfaQ [bacterium BMS3Abin12]
MEPATHDPAPRPDLPAREDIRRILIIKWSALGDVVLATAIMEDIFRAFPGRTIDLNTLPSWVGLFRDDPRFREVFAFGVRGAQRAREMRRWLTHVAARRYDLIVDLQSTDRSRILLGLLALRRRLPPWRIGNHRAIPYNFYPDALPRPSHIHERMRSALRNAGIEPRTERPVLHIPAGNRARAAALAAKHDLVAGDYAVLLPGCQAAGFLKRWGAEHYAELARGLHRKGLARVVLLGGPDEERECRRIAELAGPCIADLCGATRIPDLVPLCEGARVVVANDTGTAHVAAAAARPLVLICGPTDPRRVRPIGPGVVTVQADLPCINCYRKTCPHHTCMRLVTPGRVLDAVTEAVSRTATA